jgi:hypothetical protein
MFQKKFCHSRKKIAISANVEIAAKTDPFTLQQKKKRKIAD